MKSKSSPFLVRDLMTVGVPTCPVGASVLELTRLMWEKNWEAMVVLEEEQGHAVGVVTQDDLARAYIAGEWEHLTAEDVMAEELPTVPPDIPLTTAAQIMRDRGVRVLYMTHHASGIEYPAAWLTYGHLLRHMCGGDLADLGIKAAREKPLDTFFKRREQARKNAGLEDYT